MLEGLTVLCVVLTVLCAALGVSCRYWRTRWSLEAVQAVRHRAELAEVKRALMRSQARLHVERDRDQ